MWVSRHIGLFLVITLSASVAADPVLWSVGEGGNGNYYDVRQVPDADRRWESARLDAERQSFRGATGHLATITSLAENHVVVAMLQTAFAGAPIAAHPTELWLGAYQPDPMSEPNEGWAWITGEPWEFTRWAADEPNDYGGIVEDWLAIWGWEGNGTRGWWNDDRFILFDVRAFYIIEYPVGALNCNENDVPDAEDIRNDATLDANGNGVLDACESDCNDNGVADETDVLAGTSRDCNGNLVPDECEIDCNANEIPDDCDVAVGTSPDCDENGVPDECDFAVEQADCNNNGQLDACELAAPQHAVPMDVCVDAQVDLPGHSIHRDKRRCNRRWDIHVQTRRGRLLVSLPARHQRASPALAV